MLHGKKVVVVMPAFNAEKTLMATYDDVPKDTVDRIILVDDASSDATAQIAEQLGLSVFVHDHNLGYGGNQKTCYKEAIEAGADIVVMTHPDYQYTPKLITAMSAMIASGEFDVVLGSRILGVGALSGGMPRHKYLANRFLTFIQNALLRHKLSEYHTGYRAFSRESLLRLPLLENSDDFVFDNEILAQAIYFGLRIGEISCPTKYFPEASTISFRRSVRYGLGVLWTCVRFVLHKWSLARFRIFSEDGLTIGPQNRHYSEK
ncbi:MAG: glycosyltransferase family 2 protein [Candidatus Coatesbacteria bacterium]|nr:glycosyltransferase family 2 protein [Candidatus Coatesbacteria bacterium]